MGLHSGIVLAVFPVIFLGELPDKTMFASLMLASKGRPLATWLGTVAGFAVHVVIAVSVGIAVFKLLPHRMVDVFVAVIFAAAAIFSYRVRRDQDGISEPDGAVGRLRAAATAAGVIFVAEWGDLTQILTANLAAHYPSPLSVGVGALAALASVSAMAAAAGRGLLRLIPVRTLRIVITGVLASLALLALGKALGGR